MAIIGLVATMRLAALAPGSDELGRRRRGRLSLERGAVSGMFLLGGVRRIWLLLLAAEIDGHRVRPTLPNRWPPIAPGAPYLTKANWRHRRERRQTFRTGVPPVRLLPSAKPSMPKPLSPFDGFRANYSLRTCHRLHSTTDCDRPVPDARRAIDRCAEAMARQRCPQIGAGSPALPS